MAGCHTLKQVSCAFLFGSWRSIVAIVAGTTVSLKEHVLSAGASWSERKVSLRVSCGPDHGIKDKVLGLEAGGFGVPQRGKRGKGRGGLGEKVLRVGGYMLHAENLFLRNCIRLHQLNLETAVGWGGDWVSACLQGRPASCPCLAIRAVEGDTRVRPSLPYLWLPLFGRLASWAGHGGVVWSVFEASRRRRGLFGVFCTGQKHLEQASNSE